MARPAAAVLEYFLVGYRRVWRGSVFSSFVLPLLFFLGMGVMVGSYVDRGGGLDVPYVDFIAPGLLAFTALQIGMAEASFPVFGAFKWTKIYYAIAAAPPRASEIIAGTLAFIALRILASVTVFLGVMAAFGAVRSWWALAAPVVATLFGLAVAAPTAAFSASVDADNMLALLFRFGQLPMVLLSGVFFPVDQLPEALRPFAYVMPLWHGVELCRAATLGVAPPWPAPLHLLYLAVWLVAGWYLVRVRFTKRLVV